ncbi:hypothetical protein COO60DRAFT_1113856 [Scenedesmus sp. NREL 46B-D3]|nr:hypothetical protein COO60DRAFT_1113856 [Scenedesmus sp. NREL 46B-D3]
MAASSELLQAEDELLESMAQQQLQLAARQYTLLPVPAVTQQQQQQQQQQEAAASPSPAVAVQAETAATGMAAESTDRSSSDSRSGSSSSRAAALASWGVNGLWPAVVDMPSHPSGDVDGMFQPTMWCKGLQAVSHKSGTALSISSLQALPRALKARVVRAWLQQQLPTALTYAAVQEVLGLLQPGQGSGKRTGSLWGSSCVMRHRQLLVLLDGGGAGRLLAGELRLKQQQLQQHKEQQLEQQSPGQQCVKQQLQQQCEMLLPMLGYDLCSLGLKPDAAWLSDESAVVQEEWQQQHQRIHEQQQKRQHVHEQQQQLSRRRRHSRGLARRHMAGAAADSS